LLQSRAWDHAFFKKQTLEIMKKKRGDLLVKFSLLGGLWPHINLQARPLQGTDQVQTKHATNDNKIAMHKKIITKKFTFLKV
jgi:hypothetical protein